MGRFNDAMVFSRFRVVYHINDGFVNNITIFYGYSNTFCLTVPLSKTLKVTWIPKRSNVVNNIGYATVYECMLGDSSKLNHTFIANSSSNHSRRSHIGSISISKKITLIFLGCVHICFRIQAIGERQSTTTCEKNQNIYKEANKLPIELFYYYCCC